MRSNGRARWVKSAESVIVSMSLVLALGLAGAVLFSLGQSSAQRATEVPELTPTSVPAPTPTTLSVPPSVPETDDARQIVPTKIGDLAVEGQTLIALTWQQCVTLLTQANYYDSQAAFIELVGIVPRPGSASWEAQCDVQDELRTLVDGLGPGSVIGEIDGGDEGLMLFCRSAWAGIDNEYFNGSLSVVHIVRPSNGPEFINSIHEITTPSAAYSAPCGCQVETAQLDGDQVLFGHCRDGGTDGASTAYAVALSRGSANPLALDIRCGGTRLELDRQELVLISQGFKAGGGYDAFAFPEIRFARQNGLFIADDSELLVHLGCDLGSSSQLSGQWRLAVPAQLSYERSDSDIGVVGIHDEVVVALTKTQCRELSDSWWQNGYVQRVDAISPIADATGLEPPEGFIDWFFTCEVWPDWD